MRSTRRWQAAGAAALLVLVLTACGRAAAGEPQIVDTGCTPAADNPPPSTPVGPAVITVDDRISYWVPNAHTAPLGLSVYPDGTVITAEGNGSHTEPLTPMTIARVDGCHVRQAVDALAALADADFGMPEITDQGVTTVTVTRSGSAPVMLSAYTFGIGDEYVDRSQAAARAALTSALQVLEDATSAEHPWVPDRLQVTRFEDDDPGPARTWPLAGPIADLLHQQTYGGLACGVVDGADVGAVTAALDGEPVLASWTDGRDTVTLAVGVLVPGQPGCAG